MTKYRMLSLVISAVVVATAFATENTHQRTKRQAPNINVHSIPKTSFTCDDRKLGEYYADPEANCQVYHVCVPGMGNKMSLISFVCPNGTIFSQATRVCTPYERVDCSLTVQFYENLHGSANSRRTDYESDNLDNYVSQPQPREPSPPREQPRQQAPARNRNTPAPTPPPPAPREVPAQPQRNSNRFRSGSSQFRGQQAPPVTTPAPVRTTAAPVIPLRAVPARPALPAFRPPVLAPRPPQANPVNNVIPPRPTPRTVVSTSTANYNYEYEYEYDYEDEAPNAADQGNVRTKRDVADDYNPNPEGQFPETSFTCEDKAPGGAYADMETNCEMFHICVLLGKFKILDYKVFCANGTAFDQETGACREKDLFTCENAHMFYQFEKPYLPKSTKKPILIKKKYTKSKKVGSSKE